MMISSFVRLAFVLALTASNAAGCNSSGGSRRLGSPEDFSVDHHDHADHNMITRKLQVVDNDDVCGAQSAPVEERLEVARSVNAWKAQGHGRMLQETNKTYTVPVYIWHTYSPGSTPDKILTKEYIEQNHFAELVHGFRQMPFKFELKDIQIIESAAFGKCERLAQNEIAMKKALRVAGKDILNIYICDSSKSDSGAWSSFPIHADTDPYYDGVVLKNSFSVTEKKRINTYMNAIHEIGHWLGLEHVFIGGCTPRVWSDYDGISIVGDDVNDTPSQAGPTRDQPGAEVCWNFDPPLDTCKNSSNGNDIGVDTPNNHMDYLSGECLKEAGQFTPGQIERAFAQYETFRLDAICRPKSVTCTATSQCCDGMICKGGNPMKAKCM